MPLPIGVYRADHVGSLLRPKEILAARADLPPNIRDTSSLRPLEDEHISDVVQKELKNGLRSITDGEFRRAYFHLDFLQHLENVKVEGNLASTGTTKTGFTPPRLMITGKIKHAKPIQLDDFLYLESEIAKAKEAGIIASEETVSTKVAIPSPTMCHFRGSRDTVSCGPCSLPSDIGILAHNMSSDILRGVPRFRAFLLGSCNSIPSRDQVVIRCGLSLPSDG